VGPWVYLVILLAGQQDQPSIMKSHQLKTCLWCDLFFKKWELGMMKKMLVLVMALSLISTVAMAEGESSGMQIGLRGGLSLSPDQIHFGAHTDLGQLVGPMRVVPNVEIGFGDNLTMICINGDLLYDFPETPFSIGGEVGINYMKYDFGDLGAFSSVVDDTSTDIGFSVLGNYNLVLNNGKTLLLEAKLGLANSADFKLTAGYNFF